MSDCLFCRIVRGEIPAAKVAENATCIAFRDISPQAPVHVLVIPKQHYRSLDEVPDATVLGEMSMLAQQVARSEGVAETGYRCVVNTGKDGGQTVFHLHMHVMGGRRHTWPPG